MMNNMYKLFLYLFNYAFVNILFVNICSDGRVLGQTLRLSVNEITKFDALSLRKLYRNGKYFYFDLHQGNNTKLLYENQKLGVRTLIFL